MILETTGRNVFERFNEDVESVKEKLRGNVIQKATLANPASRDPLLYIGSVIEHTGIRIQI